MEDPAPTPDDAPAVTPLREPADGVPPVVADPAALTATIAAFAAGTGPVAVDAERASGYRYSQRAYLVQLRRAGAGTALIDPIALPDLSGLNAVLADATWVLHAASQDLACLAEVGLVPTRLVDTELAGRLLGYERVGLGTMVATVLGLGLAKEHSAADWSTRPLPEDWLRYAALDVELLVELADRLGEQLVVAGKAEWAAQEFEAVRTAPPPSPRVDPWRRVSGLRDVRDPRRLAVVRSLWTARDRTARATDVAPGRVLPDAAIVAAAVALPRSAAELVAVPGFGGRRTARRAPQWQRAIDDALALDTAALPRMHGPRSDGPPPPRAWSERDPAAAARLSAARAAMAGLSAAHRVPVENLLSPDLVRRLCWTPPVPPDEPGVAAALTVGGARPWQVELASGPLAAALAPTGTGPVDAAPVGPSPPGAEPTSAEPTSAMPTGTGPTDLAPLPDA